MEFWVPQPLSVRPVQSSCGLLVLPHEDFPQLPEWCTDIPVLAHRVAIAMYDTAAGGFVLRTCVYAYVYVFAYSVCMCVTVRSVQTADTRDIYLHV